MRAEIKTGIYRTTLPLKGDYKGIYFPKGSKVFLIHKLCKGKPLTLIEDVVNGQRRQDLLEDCAETLIFAVEHLSCNIDLSDEVERVEELQRKD